MRPPRGGCARSEAAALSTSDAVRWRALEVAAFADHPRVLSVLDPKGRYHRSRITLAQVGAVSAILFVLLLIVAPVIAFAVVLGDLFIAPSTPSVSIPVAAIITLCTLPVLVVVFVEWYRSHRGRDRFRELQTSVLGGFGLLTFALVLIRSGVQDYPDGVRWSAGIFIPSALGAVFWLVLLRNAVRQERARAASGAAPTPSREDASVRAVEPLRPVRLAVEKLSPEARDAVRADLVAAIDDLERRGVIDAGTAERARGAELGRLALRMSQGSHPR